MNGVELCARFSYITNTLGYCGPSGASKLFLDFATDKSKEEEARKAILKFEGVPPYLKVIAEANGLDMFDGKVVEAYWIGNKLLNRCSSASCKKVIEKLMQRGLPPSIGKSLIEKMPEGMVPHHNFNVFYVGVGKTSGKVATTLQNMDNCRVSWGKVLKVAHGNLYVDTQTLQEKDGKIVLREGETKTAVFLEEFLPAVGEGDIVAMHWGFAGMKLSEAQRQNLENYTRRVLSLL